MFFHHRLTPMLAGILLFGCWGCQKPEPSAKRVESSAAPTASDGTGPAEEVEDAAQNLPATARSGSDELFHNLAAEAEGPEEARYLKAAQPILDAIAARDYGRLFDLTSPLALKRVEAFQFAPAHDAEGEPLDRPALHNVTREQFLEGLKRMEEELGTPLEIQHAYILTADPEELAGGGDEFDRMMNLGAISNDVPPAIRRASLQAQISVRVPEKHVAAVASDLGVTEDEVRSGSVFGPEGPTDGEQPYLNVRLILVEDKGLKLGYFEFSPPSMLD